MAPQMRNYTKTTHSKHWLRKHPNLLIGQKLTRSNQVYVSDITYIKSRERTHYLSLVTDAYSRKIVGHHLSDDMSTEEVVKALKKAVKGRYFNKPIIHHSDRGLQYCAALYQNQLQKNNITPSMTEGYDCYQNALAERINGILKNEFLIHKCNNGKELNQYINQSIETYNSIRPHFSLNMKTPEYIHKKSSEEMIDILLDQKHNDLIPGLLPKDVKVAHKTGFITKILHDSGIVMLPDGRKYVLVILSKEWKTVEDAEKTIATISKLIYDYYQQ